MANINQISEENKRSDSWEFNELKHRHYRILRLEESAVPSIQVLWSNVIIGYK